MLDYQTEDYGWYSPSNCAHKYLLPSIKSCIQDIKLNHTTKILEAGCGGEHVMNYLFELDFKNIWGFHISESGIKVVKPSYPHLNSSIQIHSVYNNKLPYPLLNGNYDLIISTEVIEHLYNPDY